MARWVWCVALVGCTGEGPGFPGEDMLPYFPFAENLDCQWEFLNTDLEVPYRLIATVANDYRLDDVRHYVVEYRKDCFDTVGCNDNELVRSMTWSLRGNLGVHLHDATVGTTEHPFDPSLRFVSRYMKRGDTVSTETGGKTYTTTLVEFGECPVRITEWTNCVQLKLESSSGPDHVTGTYWVINDFNVIAMEWDEGDGRWELSTHRTL